VVGIFGDGQGARSSRQEVQVIDVIARSGDDGMKPAVHKDDIAVAGFECAFAGMLARVEVLKSEGVGLAHAVIVNLVQVDFAGRIVHVMLVRRIAGPVSAGRVHLNNDEFVGRERGRDDVHDLAGDVASSTQIAYDFRRGD
jgi:hypothetical protein